MMSVCRQVNESMNARVKNAFKSQLWSGPDDGTRSANVGCVRHRQHNSDADLVHVLLQLFSSHPQ